MDAREEVLSKVGQGIPGSYTSKIFAPALDPDTLWETFRERFEVLGGKVVQYDDVARLPSRDWCVDHTLLPLSPKFGPFNLTDPWSASVGVTGTFLAVAETGTLVLVHSDADRRLASLSPPHHLAIVNVRDIVATLDEALVRLPRENAVFVTGPSRTADIEGQLVRGVHGPKQVWIVIERD